MTLWALRLEYDGGPFVGWQRQGIGLAVQDVVEQAASRMNGGAPVASIVAGRTDSGVHALGQVAQIALPAGYHAAQLRDGLNYHMKPHPVVVVEAAEAPPNWNARFSAIRRCYRYRILNRRSRPGLDLGRMWHVPHPLDAHAMQEAARTLIGSHDFTSFRAKACQAKSPFRTLERLDVTRAGDVIEVVAEARSFLHHQVRNMVGTLRQVGSGSWAIERVADALAARHRAAAGPTAPPEGLYLVHVGYPVNVFSDQHDVGT